MSSTAGQSAEGGVRGLGERLGVSPDTIVMEVGHSDDSDDALRAAVVERSGSDLVGPESDEIVDTVLLWWREGDGDLTDALVDAIAPLTDDGVVWLLTPKVGREGHVEPSDVNEAAQIAGLSQTTTLTVAAEWSGIRLASPRNPRSKR